MVCLLWAMPPGISRATVQHGSISNNLAAIKQFQAFHFVLISWCNRQHQHDDVNDFFFGSAGWTGLELEK
jgi:hypothetical protein